MFYTVTFNPALDYVMDLPALRPGETNRALGEQLMPGGKGINVSLVLRELGQESVALGFSAGHTGAMLERWLRESGVRAGLLPLPAGETRINVKLSAQGTETELNGRGPDIPPERFEALLRQLAGLESGDTLILSGSAPASLGEAAYARLLAVLAPGVRAVVDAEGPLLLNALLHRPFLIKPNLRELEGLCGASLLPTDTGAIARCARSLQERGARNVLVSLGAAGALLLTQDGEVLTQPSPQGELVHSVGAGDSMVAGALVGYDRGGWTEALRLGAACGAATAFSPRLAVRSQIDRTYARLA